ncbi:hypothetical protein PR048_011513 [Dryococelus australis]|uniref:Uncharacterized protein n=1 Tax=Dryococelus australis TaxID=614101 RepID=A0ABQ9HLS5_9NEOP|nr:hypothetical protein PR048_011513 [Dryococelus australis]
MDQGIIWNLKMLYRRDFMWQLNTMMGKIVAFQKNNNLKDTKMFHVTTEDIIEATKNSSTTKIESSVEKSDDETNVTWSEASATWDKILEFSQSKKDCYTLSEVMRCHIQHLTLLHKIGH